MIEDKLLENALSMTARAVERALEALIPKPEGREARVIEAMRYAMFSGGKRLRPFLVVASADLFGVAKTSSLRVAAAIECVHCYSLIHDDLPAMDDDDLRRGKPTVHRQFDEATAILAGDALLTLAFDILADHATHRDAEIRCELVRSLSHAAGCQGMVGGQMIDLMAGDAGGLDETGIARLQQLKTGALITASVEAGAILAGAASHLRHSVVGYGRDLGVAFQMADDLLDLEGDEATLGKAVHKDAAKGKTTFVSLLGPDRARQQAAMLVDQAKIHLDPFGDKSVLLRSLADFAINRRN